MINNKVTTNDWFLGFTLPPKDNSTEDYTNMSITRIARWKILYISLINPFPAKSAEARDDLQDCVTSLHVEDLSPRDTALRERRFACSHLLDAKSRLTLTGESVPPDSDPNPTPPHE